MNTLTQLSKTKTKNQIEMFIEKITSGENKITKRFVKEMMFGIMTSGTVLLTQISRSLKESISLKKVVERLSNNLKKEINFDRIENEYLKSIKSEINDNTVIAVDDGDVTKEYATRFEKMAWVKDGNKKDKDCKLGYNTTTLFAVNATKKAVELIPLLGRLYSTYEENFKNPLDEVKVLIQRVVSIIGTVGLYVFDRGFDNEKVFNFLNQLKLIWAIRMTRKRKIKTLKGKEKHIAVFAHEIKTKYGEVELCYGRDKKGKPKKLRGRLGFRKCVVKNQIYTLIVLGKYNGEVGMMILTNKEIKGIGDMKKILVAYNARWSVEDQHRCMKQSFKLESWMVRSLLAVKNLYRLVNLVTACIGKVALNEHLRILILYIKKQAEDVYNKTKFYICCLATGISNILRKYSSSYWLRDKIINNNQLTLPFYVAI